MGRNDSCQLLSSWGHEGVGNIFGRVVQMFVDRCLCGAFLTYLDIPGSPIEIEVEVLDFAVLSKQVRDVFLRRLLVDIRCDYDPAFNTAHGDGRLRGTRFGARRARLLIVVGGGGVVLRCLRSGRQSVDFHLGRHREDFQEGERMGLADG